MTLIWKGILSFFGFAFDKMFALIFSVLPNNTVLENYFSIDISSLDKSLVRVGGVLAQFNHIFPFDTLFSLFLLFLFANIILFFLGIFMAVMRSIFLVVR